MNAIKENTQFIEKLNSTNYSTWKFKMQMFLIKEELDDIIVQDPPDPADPAWHKKDRKTRALINLSIDDSQIVNVKNLDTAKLTWEALKNIHERSNLSSKLYLLRKLYSTKLAEGANMITHITNILQIIDKLNAIGENISDSHISALFLCSLPPSYNTLITALEARPENELTPDFIKNKLTDEYNRRHEMSEQSHSGYNNNERAFKTNRRYTHTENRREQKYCNNCKMKNHSTYECWHYKSRNTVQSGNPRNNQFKNKKNFSSSLCYEKNETHRENKIPNERKYANDQTQNKALITEKVGKNNWILDSGSTSHICNDKSLFSKFIDYNKTSVTIANGNKLTALGSGEVFIKTLTPEGKEKLTKLREVLYVPDLESNLISVSKAAKNGCKLIFDDNKCDLIFDEEIYIRAKNEKNLYIIEEMDDVEEPQNYVNITYNCDSKQCIDLWHRRLGHRDYDAIKSIITNQLADGIKIGKCKHQNKTCVTCIETKLTNMPYPKSATNRATNIVDLIHSDVCGPLDTPTLGGKIYFMTLIDDYSRYTTIYLLSKKSEVAEKIKEYITMIYNQFGKKPKEIRSDNGREYVNHEIDEYLKQNGILHQLTVPHNPSQNGVAERKNKSLLDMTRSMLSQAKLSKHFWGEAINTATYLQNRLPTKANNNRTPYELWKGVKPNLKHLRTFGCKALFYVDKVNRGKLDNRAQTGTFVGYDTRSTGYRIHTQGKQIIIARTVKFLENENVHSDNIEEIQNTTKTSDDNTQLPDRHENHLEIKLDSEETPSVPKQQPIEPRRSNRTNRGVPPDRYVCLINSSSENIPENWEDIEKMKNTNDKQNWIKATQNEIQCLRKNNTWTLTDPPPGTKIIGSKWTFKLKKDNLGNVQSYKARLVAQGYSQRFGIDYDQTFAPVVSHATIRAFLISALHKNLNVKHVDITTAFLHGELTETVYMSQPDGYIKPGDERKVCKLQKAIYGLKQAAKAWYTKISETLTNNNFLQSKNDPCLYFKSNQENPIYIIIYVDDILIAGKDSDIEETINQLKKEYELKNLGEVNNYLGININKINDTYYLNQNNKIHELVKKLNLNDMKPHYTPMIAGFNRLEDDDNLLPNNTKYRQATGTLLYISTITRPDISAAVNILCRRNETPRQKDWSAVKRIISYLKTTENLNLTLSANSKPILTAYADADWAGDLKTRKSTSGNLFMLGKSPIYWITKRQNCIALSSAEAEYVSASNAAQELSWITNLLSDLNIPQKLPITIFEDNMSCIKMTENDKDTKRSKHIDIRFHNIKLMKEEGKIDLQYCPSEEMTADTLTKPTPKPVYEKHRKKLNLQPFPTQEITGE